MQSHAERIWPDSGSAAPHDISQLFQKLWIVCVSPVPEVRGGSAVSGCDSTVMQIASSLAYCGYTGEFHSQPTTSHLYV